jgi:hypothetical protein
MLEVIVPLWISPDRIGKTTAHDERISRGGATPAAGIVRWHERQP